MIFVALNKLYYGFNKILPVSSLHLFHDNFIFYNLRVPDRDRALPSKQQIVVKLVKKYLTFLFIKKSHLPTVSASMSSRKYLK